MTVFRLPDLGEGLSEAEIVRWHVNVGDEVSVDAPMLSVETAKAIVEVPAPVSGRIKALHAKPGDRVETGAVLVEFESAQSVDGEPDSGTVVGHMPAAAEDGATAAALAAAHAASPQRIRAVPAARALARSLGVDIGALEGSGQNGLITLQDVMAVGLPAGRASTMHPAEATPVHNEGDVQQLRSLRRAMSQSMALARDSVMECSVFDDADVEGWEEGTDYSTRVLRAIVAGVKAEPGLNAWFDAASQSRTLFEHIDIGIAVDTSDGLLVPVIRQVNQRSTAELRAELDRLKRAARERTIRSEELRNFTFMLSNFGMMAGRYATPVVVPPAVAILATGRARAEVVAANGQVAIHRRMPLSLTFDHRVVTGGEAVRFFRAVIADLELVR